ncbi:PilN domain-containing protein [Dethiothermospora halolimnae]|uniref:PilN domain-containing protein n=1 Tax=Dethiothermospora halolimnae TaxID=3114390 RepID=UPI003CCB9C93
MNDFNFFQVYEERHTTDNNNILIYGLTILIIIAIVTYPIINVIKIRNLDGEVVAIKEQVESPKIKSRLNEIESKKNTIEELELKYGVLSKVEYRMKTLDIVNEYLIDILTKSMPSGIHFSSIKINRSSIQVDGVGMNKDSIAILQNNLRKIELFDNMYVPSISSNRGFYNFSLTMNIKGVNIDEAN